MNFVDFSDATADSPAIIILDMLMPIGKYFSDLARKPSSGHLRKFIGAILTYQWVQKVRLHDQAHTGTSVRPTERHSLSQADFSVADYAKHRLKASD